MDWLGFAGSILGGLIGGFFTFIGVKLTLKYEKGKERREALAKANETKPRLEIVNYRAFNETGNDNTINNDCNVLALSINAHADEVGNLQFYDNSALDDDKFVFVEYVLKNTGETEISEVDVTSTLPKDMAVVEFERRENYLHDQKLSYDVLAHKRFIKPGDTLTLRIYYVKDQVPYSQFRSALFAIWLWDINGRIWRQSLFSPNNEAGVPELSTKRMFHDSTDVNAALDCFRDPRLW